jgi:SNF2-related domain/Helicase conserved C-terminal domain
MRKISRTEDLVPKSLAAAMRTWRLAAKKWVPHEYQERAIKFMLENGYAGLLLSPGMGKTSTTLAVAKVLMAKGLVKRVLVVAPLRPCYDTWPAEVCAWEEFKDFGVALLHGPGKDKVLRALEPGHQIVLINPEGMQWLCSSKKNMDALGPDVMLVVDESSLWKSSTTVRFRAVRKWLRTFRRRYILTGSPRPRNYLDLHGQVLLMDLGMALGEYLTHYRNNFFYPTGYQMREWAPLPGSAERIDALVAPMVMRLDARDYLKLPKEMEQTHRVVLPPKARKEYDQVEGSLLSTLFTQPLVNSASSRAKCCQMANGAVYLDADPEETWKKNRPVKTVHSAKVDALAELVAELQGEPLLVGIGYRHDVEAIRKALGKDIPCINGETTRGQAADYIDRWNKGLLPVMLGHPASMGHGLNLQKFNSRHVAYFDLPDNYDTYSQFYQRVNRQGNKSEFVMKHHFVADDTVDVAKMRNLREKATGQNAFLTAMKRYTEERRRRG